MKKINFFTSSDMDIISNNLDNIIDNAKKKQIKIIDPTIDEYYNNIKIILDYIKKEKRIVYGGYAWNQLLAKKNKELCFYKETDYADIEFYSNKPIHDLKALCDILYKSNKYVQGKNAQHEETYKIFVNFINYCDITYMPYNLYSSLNTHNINNLKIIEPIFIFIDLLRVFTDPMTSYFRLEKNIKRGRLLFENYPINFSSKKYSINELSNNILDIISKIVPYLIENNLLFIGDITYNIYVNNDFTYPKSILEVISNNLENDVKSIYNILFKFYINNNNSKLYKNISIDQYYPFFQFLDKKVIFKYNNIPFLILYGNNRRCVPFNNIKINILYIEYDIKIGTFNVYLMYTLILFYKYKTENNNPNKSKNEILISNLIYSRYTFLKKNNKNILDDTIYKDFNINCIGDTIDFIRNFHLKRKNKNYISGSYISYYDPDDNKFINPDKFYFENTSGNIFNIFIFIILL